MIRYLFITMLTLCYMTSTCQDITYYDINSSAGQSTKQGNLYVHWTIGESVFSNGSASDLYVGQGFPDRIWRVSLLLDADEPIHPLHDATACFPNPATDYVKIELGQAAEFSVELFDIDGKFISKQTGFESIRFDLSNISTNMLMARILDEDGQYINTYKIVKSNQ